MTWLDHAALPPATDAEMRAAYESESDRMPIACRIILAHATLRRQGKRAYCPDIWRAVQAGQVADLPLFQES